jgi:putative transposase
MPNYRRAFVPGGTYFFTVVTHRRRPLFGDERYRTLLGTAMRTCRQDWPFTVDAMVLLPDHLHAIWTLPPGDDRYSGRWSVIKRTFTQWFLAEGGIDGEVSAGKRREHRRGVWQRRFWEHTIADEDDFQSHFDYIHYNPVKHGYVRCPHQWPASTFHRWVEHGVYPHDWACGSQAPLNLGELKTDAGEPI